MNLKAIEARIRRTRLAMKIKRTALQLFGREPWTNPDIHLPHEDIGDWAVDVDRLDDGSTIYSFGVGDNVDFETVLIDRLGVNVYAFDPTPKSVEWVESNVFREHFKFFPYGIAAEDGEMRFSQRAASGSGAIVFSAVRDVGVGAITTYGQVFRLDSLLRMFNHSHIDLLKLDIEGMEFEVLPDILQSGIRPTQVCVEVHHRFFADGKKKMEQLVALMKGSGYRIFSISDLGREYSFVLSQQ